jgi:hypothetical protein
VLYQVRFLFGIDYFEFEPEGSIGVESRWVLRTAEGDGVESTRESLSGDIGLLRRVLGRRVTTSSVDPPTSFTLMFDDGTTFTVFDDSEEFESFCIHPGDIYI